MCTYVVHGFLYCHVCVVFIVVPCNAASAGGLAFFNRLGRMTTYLKNTDRFIRHAIRVRIYDWYERLVPGMFVLDAITHDRSIVTRQVFVQEGASFVSFSDPRGASTTRALRQAAVNLKKTNPQARFTGSAQGSLKNNPRVKVAFDPRVARISRAMTRPDPTHEIFESLDPPDPRDSKLLDPTQPDLIRDI